MNEMILFLMFIGWLSIVVTYIALVGSCIIIRIENKNGT